MYYLATLVVAAVFGLGVLAQSTTTLAYDTIYDNASLSLDQVACSNGPNGLDGYGTLGKVPGYPNVGGVFTVEGWGSPECGSCYAVTYGSTTINVIAVDKSTVGFTVSLAAMNNLTGGQATTLGRVQVTYSEVDRRLCNIDQKRGFEGAI